jgi:hypothetical protein
MLGIKINNNNTKTIERGSIDNGPLNKYKKNLKNGKKVYRCVFLPLD